jgi:hypothetical protein
VTLDNPAGYSYNGYHGNGTLDGSGYADVGYWPGINGNTYSWMPSSYYQGSTGVTQAAGSGFKGGNWWNDAAWMRTSDRKYAAFGFAPRDYLYGFRGVRSVQ